MNRKTELFLNKYKELEALIAAAYNLRNSESAVNFLLNRPESRAFKTELDYCREVRNLLTHNPKINDRFPVEPSDEMLALLERLVDRFRNPQRAKHIMVPIERVSCRAMDDLVLPAMREMNENIYTHIPILENGVVTGVFSENTLLSALLDDGCLCATPTLRFRDLADYLPIERHRAESFRFLSLQTPVSEIEDIFADALRSRERLGLLFVTAYGKPAEKLLGVLSAWDVAGLD